MVFSPDPTNEDSEQAETQQPSPAALFSEVAVGLDAGLAAMPAPAGDGACSGRSPKYFEAKAKKQKQIMRYTPKLVRALAATFITIGSLPGEANAAAYYTFTEENGDVVLRASGTLDVTQFSFSNDITRAGYVYLDSIWIAPMVYGPADFGYGVAILRNRFGWNIPFAAQSAGVIESGDTFVAVFADGDASTFIQSPTTLVNGSFDSSIITPNMVVRWNGYDFNSMGMDLTTPDTDILIWKSNVLAGDEGSIFLRISTIPEPSSSFLVGLGALLLTVRRRGI